MRKLAWMLSLLLFVSLQMFAQDRTVTGKVTDENGTPIANASVLVKGGTKGTKTNSDGSFKIVVASSARQLVVSSVGFETITVIITGGVQTIQMKASAGELSGVVVTGYSKVKKSEYVGSASRIDKKAIENIPTGSFDQVLQGRAPGLRVSTGSGAPGASASIQIRGPKSISGGSEPLYIVDGVPVEAGVFQGYNANDFESVDVLKDANAAALYGSRGGAGVIVVTTKRGRKGSTSFSYRPQYGITQPGQQQFEMMNSSELLQFQEKLGAMVSTDLPGWRYSRLNPSNAGLPEATLTTFDGILDSLRNTNTDWRKVFMRTGKFQSHDISLSGGSDRTRFFSSVNYYAEDGIAQRSDMKRLAIRFNLDHSTDKLTFQFNNTIGYTTRNTIEQENNLDVSNPFLAAYLALPYDPQFLSNGNVNNGSGKIGGRAYSRILDVKRYNNQLKGTSSAIVNYEFNKNFYAGANLGLDFRETIGTLVLFPNTFTASVSSEPTRSGVYGNTLQRRIGGNTRGYVGYKSVFGKEKEHKLDVQLNSEYIFYNIGTFQYTGYKLEPKTPNTPAGITNANPGDLNIPVVGGGKTQRAYVSQFAVVKYSFKDKYVADITYRIDKASNLPQTQKSKNFWAAGFLWNTLKEDFARDWEAVSTLRVRASLGQSANAENFPGGDFGLNPLYRSGQYAGNISYVPATVGNLRADWEYQQKANLGFEFGFWKDRLTGEVNLYNEVSKNLFIEQRIPIEGGAAFSRANVNAGEMRNRGIEVNLNYFIIQKSDLKWSVGGNFAYNRNVITSLGQEKEYNLGTSLVRVGLPLGSHFAMKWAGVDASTGNPLYYTRDGQLTSQLRDSDFVADFGTSFAPWTGGFNTNVTYKGFDLAVFFNFQAKFARANNQDFFQMNHAFAIQGFNMRRDMLQMWTKPGDVTNIQSPLTAVSVNTSKLIQDASYLRLRNVQIGYTVPAASLAKTKVIKGLRFFVQAQNLYTWTRWTGFDPEDDDNIAQYEYPVPRTYTFGLNLTF